MTFMETKYRAKIHSQIKTNELVDNTGQNHSVNLMATINSSKPQTNFERIDQLFEKPH